MTPNKSTSLLWFALPLALFAAGCQKDAAEEADTATEKTAEVALAESEPAPSPETAVDTSAGVPTEALAPVPGTDAAIIEDHSAMATPGFDAKAFEGRYVSGETSLLISADGVYALNIDGATIDGTWSPQPGGKRVTLDPDSKTDTDRQLDIASKDSVNIVGGATLTRDNSAQ